MKSYFTIVIASVLLHQNISSADIGTPPKDDTTQTCNTINNNPNNNNHPNSCTSSINHFTTLPLITSASTSSNHYNNLLTNRHDLCEFWAKEGECWSNARYMRIHCDLSCRTGYMDFTRKMENNDGNNDKDDTEDGIDGNGETEEKKEEPNTSFSNEQCSLYLAESSIPNSGLGMFTSKPIPKNTYIYYPEIVLHIHDHLTHHNRHANLQQSSIFRIPDKQGRQDNHISCRTWAKDGECDKNKKYMLHHCSKSCAKQVILQNSLNFHDPNEQDEDEDEEEKEWLPESYVWNPRNTRSTYEANNVESLIPGLGMLANSHTGLVNSHLHTRPLIDGLHHHQYSFINGDSTKGEGEGDSKTLSPSAGAYSYYHDLRYFTSTDIPAGMELFVEYGDDWFTEREEKFGKIPTSQDFKTIDTIVNNFFEEIVDTFHDEHFGQELLDFMHEELLTTNERIQMSIPTNLSEARIVKEKGAALLSVKEVVKSSEWLEQHGLCLDNIRPGISTLPEAGRGAFATRTIHSGGLVAPAPLVHLKRGHLHLYQDGPPTGDGKRQGGTTSSDGQDIRHIGEQLLLNYCYGHSNSSLLLFPYSPVINFINHHDDPTKVNTRIQWSTLSNHHSEWMEESVTQVLDQPYAGLILEFIAIRDIQPNEEIFIDYGERWSDAWKTHVKQWDGRMEEEGRGTYIPAQWFNRDGTDKIRTQDEQVENPYPPNILTVCYVSTNHLYEDEENDDDEDGIHWQSTEDLFEFIDLSHECKILERQDSNNEYTVSITHEGETHTIIHVPRHAIEFVDDEYTSDQHLVNAFRHEIELSDEIFPQMWMDLQ